MSEMMGAEPWVDKRGLAEHLCCSVRSIEHAIVEGMPHAVIFGRVKFRTTETEAWLERTGRLERRGTLEPTANRPDDAAHASGPDTRSEPHAS